MIARRRGVGEDGASDGMAPKCLVVMYHYIRDAGSGGAGVHGLDVDAFGAQLDMMSASMAPIDWPTFRAWRAGRRRISDRSFLVTFDDGLAEHGAVVGPMLERRGMRGLFFVSTGFVGAKDMASAHKIHLLISKLGAVEFLSEVRSRLGIVGESGKCAVEAGGAEAKNVYGYESGAVADLKYLLTFGIPIEDRRRVVDGLFEAHVGDAGEWSSRWYLDWPAVERLDAAGHTIGGHGHEHEPLLRWSAAEQGRDLARSAVELNRRLGERGRPMSYPYGSFDADVARRSAFAGFVNGFTTREGWIGPQDDAHQLCRVDTIHVGALMEREFTCVE